MANNNNNNNNFNGPPFNGYPPLPYPSSGGPARPYPPAVGPAAVPSEPVYGWNSTAPTNPWGSAHGGNGPLPSAMSFAKPPGSSHFGSSGPAMPAMPGGFGHTGSTPLHGGNGGPAIPSMPPGYGSHFASPSAPQMPGPGMSVTIGGSGGHFGQPAAYPVMPSGHFGGSTGPHQTYANSMSFVKPGAGYYGQPASESFVKPGSGVGGHFGGVAAPAMPPSTGFGGGGGQISCIHCTLLNPGHRVVCEACERPLR